MLQDVPEYSGMFYVPGFIDAPKFIFWNVSLEFRYVYLNKPFGAHLPPRVVHGNI